MSENKVSLDVLLVKIGSLSVQLDLANAKIDELTKEIEDLKKDKGETK